MSSEETVQAKVRGLRPSFLKSFFTAVYLYKTIIIGTCSTRIKTT